MAAEQMELITIGGKVFPLPFTSADSERRKKYFEIKQYEKEPNILAQKLELPTQEGGFSTKQQSSNSEWLDSLLISQNGGSNNNYHISIRIQATGELLKKAKTIFDNRDVNDKDFYIPIAELDISGSPLDISGALTNIGDFIVKQFTEKNFEPQKLSTFKVDYDTTIVSQPFKILPQTLLDDILRNILIELGFLNEGDNFDKDIKEYKKDNIFLSINLIAFKYLHLLLGKKIIGNDSFNNIIKSVTDKQNTINNSITLSENAELQILVNNEEKYRKLFSKNITTNFIYDMKEHKTEEYDSEEDKPENPANIKTPFLKHEEIVILQTLGFDYELMRELGSYLPAFFDSLPSCSTDASMLLKHECETAYFVLWSVMFKAQSRLQERMKEESSKSKFIPDIESGMARQTTRSLFDLHKKTKTEFNEKDILTLFTIVRKSLFTPEQKKAILRIFTIVRDQDLSQEQIDSIYQILSV